MTFVEMAAALGVVSGTLIATLTLMEKITGIGARWLARGVAAGTHDLRSDVNDVKAKQSSMATTLDEVQHLQLYHLGVNGGSTRMHERVEAIERAVLRAERRPPAVDWHAPYDEDGT